MQWAADEGSGFAEYSARVSAIIEKAYQEKQQFAEFTEEDESNHLRKCKVIFKDMVEIVNNDASNSNPVRRKTPGALIVR